MNSNKKIPPRGINKCNLSFISLFQELLIRSKKKKDTELVEIKMKNIFIIFELIPFVSKKEKRNTRDK